MDRKTENRPLLLEQVTKSRDHGSDHLPIYINIDISLRKIEDTTPKPYNYKKTDWEKLKNALREYVSKYPPASYTPSGPDTVDRLAASTRSIDQHL